MLKRPTIIVIALLAANGIAVAADLTAGQTLFKVCAPCHEIGVNAKNRVGPILNGLDGRPAGSVAGYSYSQALKYSGIVWREAVLKKYLKNPSAMVPRSTMFFSGLLDEAGLDDLWSFVKQYGPDGIVSPSAEQTRDAPASAGQTLFKVCAPCHEIGVSASNRVGPMLNGLDGRPAGSVTGYPYSPATKHSGIVWGEAVFKEYLKDPKAKVPGTKMGFTGLLDEAGLDALWSFVKQYGPDEIVTPSAEQTRDAPASESK